MTKQKSFTLIELLVVIVIIGILAGVIMISTSSSIDKANIAKGVAFSDSLKNSMLLNLISEWNFDEITGDLNLALADNTNVSDAWGANDGKTYYGPILRGKNDCVIGKCLEFNGDKANVDIVNNTSLAIKENITIEYWVMQHSGVNWTGYCQETVSRRNCYDICCSELYTKMNNIYNDTMIADGLIPAINKWSHVVYIYDYANKTGYFYMDGKLKNTRNLTTVYSNYTDYTLGTNCGNLNLSNYNYTFKGRLDEMRIYNAALSSSQIKQNYIVGLNSMFANGSMSKEEYSERIKALAIK